MVTTMRVPELTDQERDDQVDGLKYYLYDQRGRLAALLNAGGDETPDGAWPSHTGLDPDIVQVARSIKAEGRHVEPTIRRVDREPRGSVLNVVNLFRRYPASHWTGWRQALLSLPARQNEAIAMTVLDFWTDDNVAAAWGLTTLRPVQDARRDGLRAMVLYLHRRRCR